MNTVGTMQAPAPQLFASTQGVLAIDESFSYSVEKKKTSPATVCIKKHRRAEPQWRINKMPKEYKGICCDGIKKWGDGKGTLSANNERVYFCHACWSPLPKIVLTPEIRARIAENKARAEAIRDSRQT